MAKVWLVRHAPTTLRGVCYGQSDVPVAVDAVEAARLVEQRWRAGGLAKPERLWCSPWSRTHTLAAELARHWQLALQVDARLSELDFGLWEGRTYDEIARADRHRWEQWAQNYDSYAPPAGETVNQLRERVEAWLDERRREGVTVLAVTHAGVVRTARALAARATYASVAGEPVPNLQPELV